MPAIRNESTSKAKAATRSDPTGQTRSRGSNKPVQCEVCGKVLNRKPDLNRHMLIHNEDAQRWKCHYENCTFAAIQRSNLNTHIATHTGKKNHACPDCEYATSDPAALTRHRKRQHQYVPKSRRKMPNNNKGKAPEVQPSTCLEQQPVATDEQQQQQPVAGPSTMLVPATFTDYSSSPSPSPSASGSERHYSSEPYDPAATAGYSGYASPAASVEAGDDYYPSPLNSEDEAASVGGSRGGTPSSVSSASSSGSSSSGSPSPSRESSVGVGASSTGSRSASIPPPLPLQAQARPSSGIVLMRTNPGSDDFIKQEEADVDWARQLPPPQHPQDQAASPLGAGNFDYTQYLNTSNENLPQQAGAAAGLEDTTNSVWCVGNQPWMPEMIQTDGSNFVAQDPFEFESNLFLPTSTLGGCVPNIGGLAWESASSTFGFGGSDFGFDPVHSPSTSFMPPPRPVQNSGASMSRGVKIQQERLQQQQQVYPTPRTFSPSPTTSREVTPLFDLNEVVGSYNDSWF